MTAIFNKIEKIVALILIKSLKHQTRLRTIHTTRKT